MTAMIPEIASAKGLASGEHGSVVWLAGRNFSGRSELIQVAARTTAEDGGEAIIIPPELALSGMVATVQEELRLHLGEDSDSSVFWKLAKEWGLRDFDSRAPHSLSGGERALLSILCKLALSPRLIGLDGALEQLDPANVARVIAALNRRDVFPPPCVALIAHHGVWPATDRIPFRLEIATLAGNEQSLSAPRLHIPAKRVHSVPRPASIALSNATFHYSGGKPVFEHLDLVLHSGRIYRLEGANGAGKSTLARLLCGILRLTAGIILVNDQPFDPYRHPGTLARLHFQDPDKQLFRDSVRKEVDSLDPPDQETAIDFAELGKSLDTHPFDLPYVLRKRLALSMILHTSAPWLIFDEPTLGQDSAAQEVVARSLRLLADAGLGVIFVSHNQSFANFLTYETLDCEKWKTEPPRILH